MTNTTTPALSLNAIAARANTEHGTTLAVENIGGGVMALVDFGGLTVTLNGGRRSVDTDEEGPADVLVCFDCRAVVVGTARLLDEAVALVGTAAASVAA